MDELIHHCVREVSFDGDLGCDVGRLKDFITGFYIHASSNGSDTGSPQNVDDAFCAFVWSILVNQSDVHVGTVPPGSRAEVHVAPQTSASRKGKGKGKATENPDKETIQDGVAAPLSVIDDAKIRPLHELLDIYGESLRIAVDAETAYATISGSHIRPSKLTPMVYTVLQLVARAREQGISTVDLGRKTGYDQKAIHYLVGQLLGLNMVLKMRQTGNALYVCVLRYFFERSDLWKSVREAETGATATAKKNKDDVDGAQVSEDDEDKDDPSTGAAAIDFEPMDSRELASMSILRSRVIKLLKSCPDQTHATRNMLIRIGFLHPTKPDRRFFKTQLRVMASEGSIEFVKVRSGKRDGAWVKCIWLSDESAKDSVAESTVVEPMKVVEADGTVDSPTLKMNATIHRQIIDVVDGGGTEGVTLSDICVALGNFDPRTIELLLTRLEANPPPQHLADLGICRAMDHVGRERRYKYFTLAHYKDLAVREGLAHGDDVAQFDKAQVGDFMELDPSIFYADEAQRDAYVDSFKTMFTADMDARSSPSKSKAAQKKHKNPILPDGTVKKGRPRKNPDAPARQRGKKKAKVEQSANGADLRGAGPEAAANQTPDAATVSMDALPISVLPPQSVPKKRGRPPKRKVDATENGDVSQPGRKRRKPNQASISAPTEMEGVPSSPMQSPVLEIPHEEPNNRSSATLGPSAYAVNNSPPMYSGLDQDTPNNGPAISFPTMHSTGSGLAISTAAIGTSLAWDQNAPSTQPVDVHAGKTPSLNNTAAEPSAQAIASTQEAEAEVISDIGSPLTPLATLEAELSGLVAFSRSPSPLTLQPVSEIPSATLPPLLLPAAASLEDVASAPATESPTAEVKKGRPRVKSTNSSRASANLSHARRENEFLRVIERLGGVVTTGSKDFLDAHQALLEEMAQAKETLSGLVGTRTDKRTVDATFKKMEAAGKVKLLKTVVVTATGMNRPILLVYLPHVAEKQLTEFLVEFGRSGLIPRIPEIREVERPIAFDDGFGERPQRQNPGLQRLREDGQDGPEDEKWAKNRARAEQMFTYDQETIRELLLTETTTLGQLYGFIVPKITRACHMHLISLRALLDDPISPYIVSRDQRIISLPYYWSDIRLADYCSIVSPKIYEEDIFQRLRVEDGRNLAVRDLPLAQHELMQIGHARSRGRVVLMMDLLRTLNLVVPLAPLKSGAPYLSCPANGDHPTSFEVASTAGLTVESTIRTPAFWHFREVAPLHLWAKAEEPPPFWKDVPVKTIEEAQSYWTVLHDISAGNPLLQHSESSEKTSITGPLPDAPALGNSLRRSAGWRTTYVRTWHQEQYMRKFIDFSTGSTPLQDDDGGEARLEAISYTTTVPREAIIAYFTEVHEKHLRDAEKARRKRRRRSAEDVARQRIELAKKGAAARRQRERDWDEMLQRVHNESVSRSLAVRFKQLRRLFLEQRGHSTEKWESDIRHAVEEVQIGPAAAGLSSTRPLRPTFMMIEPPDAAPAVVHSNDRSVRALIEEQGPKVVPKVRKKEKKKKKKQTEDEVIDIPADGVQRRRFQWTREYDELLRDAAAIINARSRYAVRKAFSALEQVFPAVPTNSARQRMMRLIEEPTAQAYAERLEDRWHELWLRHRCSPSLPDPDPTSLTNFDLVTHVEFLRKHVDKTALRIGHVVSSEQPAEPLPATIKDLEANWSVVEKPAGVPYWDFMWNVVEEGNRDKKMQQFAFSAEFEDLPALQMPDDESASLAESALKMVLGTPRERYDAERAANLLRSAGEQEVAAAQSNLLNRGVIAKLIRDPTKPKPGRALKISDLNQSAIGGTLAEDTFQDAAVLYDALTEDEEWREWSLLAPDGDVAALLEMTSRGQIEFDIDTSNAQAARANVEFNSKKTADDDIETSIRFRLPDRLDAENTPTPSSNELAEETSAIEVDEAVEEHGTNVGGEAACCSKTSEGAVVDCQKCLNITQAAHVAGLSSNESRLVHDVLQCIKYRGSEGITKHRLITELVSSEADAISILDTVGRLCDPSADISLVFWAGYATPVLVSSHFASRWTVSVHAADKDKGEPVKRVFPRRWLDVHGRRIPAVWEAAQRAVLGVVVFRPGVSQAELRWRLRAVYDRQEVREVLMHLLETGHLEMRTTDGDGGEHRLRREAVMPDDSEEKQMFWTLGERRRWFALQ